MSVAARHKGKLRNALTRALRREYRGQKVSDVPLATKQANPLFPAHWAQFNCGVIPGKISEYHSRVKDLCTRVETHEEDLGTFKVSGLIKKTGLVLFGIGLATLTQGIVGGELVITTLGGIATAGGPAHYLVAAYDASQKEQIVLHQIQHKTNQADYYSGAATVGEQYQDKHCP